MSMLELPEAAKTETGDARDKSTVVDPTPALDDMPTLDGHRSKGGRRRRSLPVVSLAVLAAAGIIAWNWPVHRYAEQPGPVLDLATRVKINDATVATTSIHGSFDGLTVELAPLTLGELVVHDLTGDPTTVVPANEVEPPGIDPSVYNAYEKAAYVDGSQIAAAVAERSLGYSVTTHADGLEIFDVATGSAAATSLTAGDVITAVNGQLADTTAVLAAAVSAAHGTPISLTVTTSGVTRTVTVTPAPLRGSSQPVIGVMAAPANPIVNLAIPVTSDSSGVSGPSAGLMTALTVYDELSPDDVAAGRKIAGTGTLDTDGNVGEIGGIQAKARAALAAGAQLFLAPASQAADARAVLGNRVPVVGVTTFADALAALKGQPITAATSS